MSHPPQAAVSHRATSAPGLAPREQAAVAAALAAHGERPGALLPLLHAVQDALGWVPAGAVPEIAAGLNLSRAEVHGVISFYHYFRQQAPGRQVIYLCRAEACQAVGAVALERHVRQRLGIGFGQTTADGSFTLEAVYCLGNCACGPSLMIGQELHGRVDPAEFDRLAAAAPRAESA